MKKYLLIICALILGERSVGQHLQIRQSMETSELRDEPAQVLVTVPKDEPATWMLDIGLAYRINAVTQKTGDTKLISKLTAEFHRKTETDEEQNNLQIGYGYLWKLTSAPPDRVNYFMEGDLKYVYDGISIDHSIALDATVTPYRSASDGPQTMHWNAPNFFGHYSAFLSPHAGIQAQDVFHTPDDKANTKGFILRPLFDVQAILRYNRQSADSTPMPDVGRLFELSLKYVGRYDVVNTTDFKEDYTSLFTAAFRYFPFKSSGAKASLGVSYNIGSDPVRGLADQSYWLFSVNLSL